MEKTLENAIDNGLESISSGLYIFSIGVGIVLVVLGAIFFLINKGTNGKKKIANGGLICIVIGVVAIVSGVLQL